MNHDLEPLHKAHGKFPALLHLLEVSQRDRAAPELGGEQIRGRDGVFQREIDADAPGG